MLKLTCLVVDRHQDDAVLHQVHVRHTSADRQLQQQILMSCIGLTLSFHHSRKGLSKYFSF